MSDFKKQFGYNLKKIRKKQGLTQEQLAELVDLHYRQMSKIETGENFPSGKTIEKLCYALKASPSILFNFDLIFDSELVKTGTDNAVFCKAIRENNVIFFRDYIGEALLEDEVSCADSEKKLLKMANNLGKIITVEYFENEQRTKILEYHPNGKINVIKSQDDSAQDVSSEFNGLISLLENNKEYVDFVNLAINALNDNDALERLELVINGIKLARKKQ